MLQRQQSIEQASKPEADHHPTPEAVAAGRPTAQADGKPMVEEPASCEILVIDDEEGMRQLMRWILEGEGYHVHEASDGSEALRILEEQTTMDLVLLDVRMPGLSGLDVCRAIREHHAVDELPILFVTGKDSLETLLEGFEAGGNDYLVKPVRSQELVARVKLHLSTLSAIEYRRRLRQAVQVSREERELRRQLFEEREKERRRLAQELHDGPMQDLHAAALALQRQPETVAGQLDAVMSNLRAICTELRPPALLVGGLSRALKIHLGQLRERFPQVDFRSSLMDDGQQLTEWSRLQLFRISQEALGNALRHAEPTRIELGFEIDAEGYRLWVRDDGRGFELPDRWIELTRHQHFGLVGINERAGSLGGTLVLDSAPGQGTELRIEVLGRAEEDMD